MSLLRADLLSSLVENRELTIKRCSEIKERKPDKKPLSRLASHSLSPHFDMKILLVSCALFTAARAGFSSGWENHGWQEIAPAWPSPVSGGWQGASTVGWPAAVSDGWHPNPLGGAEDLEAQTDQEDQNALSAVGLARLLGGGASHAHHGLSAGHKYTISGPTQTINTIHKIQLNHPGGHILHRAPAAQHKKIIFIQPPSHGWH